MGLSRVTVAGLAIAALSAATAGGLLLVRDGSSAPAPPPPMRPAPARTPVLASYAATAPDPSATGIDTALASALRDPALGGSVAATVVDPDSGDVVYDRRSHDPVPPASTTKLVTAAAALTVLGPDARITTRVVLDGSHAVLVGGGDPTLAGPASRDRTAGQLTTLVARTAAALRSRAVSSVEVGYDASLFTGPSTAPGWRPGYVTGGDVAPITALSIDAGRLDPRRRARSSNPPLAAARTFAGLLRRAGVRVAGDVSAVHPPATARQIAEVSSAPVGALVERMLTVSDNDLAEALARQVALRTGDPPNFAGAAAAITAVAGRLGLPVEETRLVDGSGLSRSDRLTTGLLAGLVALAATADHPELRTITSGLPVAGFTGTLDERYRRAPAAAAAGDVRAKTGTLAGVNSLAGLLVDRDGRLLAFAIVADHAPAPDAAEAALDRLAARLAACGCP